MRSMLKCQLYLSRSPNPHTVTQMGALVALCGGNDKGKTNFAHKINRSGKTVIDTTTTYSPAKL